MTEEPKKSKSELATEMETLAQQLGATLRAAWNSQERKDIQTEIETGLQEMSESLKQVSQEIATTPAAQRVKAEADTYRERVKEGELGRKVQTDLAAGLRAVSEQLRKLADSWTPVGSDSDEEPPAT